MVCASANVVGLYTGGLIFCRANMVDLCAGGLIFGGGLIVGVLQYIP